jgi:hypothetical protein
MSMGYEGLVRVMVDATEDAALATGGAVPKSRVRMESSSGYGGQIRTPIAEIGLGTPRTYGWTEYDGSVDLELTEDFWDNQIKTWLFDRQRAATVNLKSRTGNAQTFSTCYWNSMSISASEGSAVTASLGFVAMERDTYTIGGGYAANKTGDEILCSPPPYNVPDPLNPSSDSNVIPIPYWNTKVELDGSLVEFVTWTLDFSQEVVKFFSCEDNASPVEPRFVGVGPMTATFSGDYMFVDAATFLTPNSVSTLDLTLGSVTLKMEDLELTSADDALQDQGSIVPIAVDYSIYELVS